MASFYDTFVRANNAGSIGTSDSGLAWSNVLGTQGILSNQVYNPSGATAYSVVDLGTGDTFVRSLFSVNHTGMAILLRYTDANNFLQLRNNNGSNYTLSKTAAGVFTNVASFSITAVNGDCIAVRCSGANISFYLNGVQRFSATDSFNQSVTKFGLKSTDTTARFGGMAAQAITPPGTIWYASPTGSWFGDGTVLRPWDYRTSQTVAKGALIGGDRVRVRGGVHGTSGDPVIVVTIGDGVTPVNVERMPGDTWPRIRTGMQLFNTLPGQVKYWGLDFEQDNIARINNYRGDNPTYGDGGIILESPGCEFHYCIVANNAYTAWFYGEQALGALVHMCYTYFNGFRDLVNGLPATQGFYRQADDAGTGKYQLLDNCVTCFNYQSGMQIYGSGASKLNFAKTLNSLWFYGGYLGSAYSGGQAIREILIGSTSTFVHVDKCYFDRNWMWGQSGTLQDDVQIGYNGKDNTFVSFTNNVLYGGTEVHYFRNLEWRGNTIIQPVLNGNIQTILYDATIGALPAQAGVGYDYNTYYQTNDGIAPNSPWPLIWNDNVINHNFFLHTPPDWTASTGYDTHSTIAAYNTRPTMWTVNPNFVEPAALSPTPRANIFVFNFQALGSISLDLSSCLTVGDTYIILDWGQYGLDDGDINKTPVASGTYSGAPVSLPLGTQYMPFLNADQTSRAQHSVPPTLNVGSGAMPGAYILVKTGTSVILPPVTALPIPTRPPLWGPRLETRLSKIVPFTLGKTK